MSIPAFVGDELLCPSDYIGAGDLIAKNRPEANLTITAVAMQDLIMQGGKTSRKAVISFKETPKKFIPSKTSIKTIVELYGMNAADWAGKRITIYHTTTAVGKKKNVPCLRVREVAPEQKQTPTQETK